MNRRFRRKANGPPFAQLYRYMLNTGAWKSLSLAARAAMIELHQCYNGVNNGRIAMSVRLLAERLGCSKDTAARALNELEEKGFVEVVKVGTFRRHDRLATEYCLAEYRNDVTGALPTKKFMDWKPQPSRLRVVGHDRKARVAVPAIRPQRS